VTCCRSGGNVPKIATQRPHTATHTLTGNPHLSCPKSPMACSWNDVITNKQHMNTVFTLASKQPQAATRQTSTQTFTSNRHLPHRTSAALPDTNPWPNPSDSIPNTYPMLYKMDRNPLWNVFLNMSAGNAGARMCGQSNEQMPPNDPTGFS
jgi:hypothetical protein